MMAGHDGWGFGLGGGFMWIIWILLGVLVVWLVRASIGNGSGNPASPSALDILKQRYARGEIDQDEYERKRKNLIR